MYKVHNLIKIIIILFCFTTTVLAECFLKFGENQLLKPRITKKVGFRKLHIPTNDISFIRLKAYEEVVGSCDIQFESPSKYNNLRELNIQCRRGDLAVNGLDYQSYVAEEMLLECAVFKWNLYELSEQFAWCPSDMASYTLSRLNEDYHSYTNLAGICYDTENMSLASMHYTIAPRHIKYLTPTSLIKYFITPRVEIENVKEIFSTKSIDFDIYDNQQLKEWIKFANYEYNSTIQNPVLYNEVYNEYGSLLDFVWWPSLRLGNWKRYEEALARHVEKDYKSYDILAGTSDVVMAPVKENCETNYTMKEFIDGNNRKIPLYIWNYLQPTAAHNSSDEVVVIAFNSPFFEFYSEQEAVFCKDICNEIEWLNNVRSSFRHRAMGVIFCCTVEDVKASKRLSGFPEEMYETTPQTTTTLPLPLLNVDRIVDVEEENISDLNEY